jgi:glycosyltransferase involved in cell wall biosynthesis
MNAFDAAVTHIHLVLPSLKVSGGVREALRLGHELDTYADCSVGVLCMWQSLHSVSETQLPVSALSGWRTRIGLALVQLPVLAVRFFWRVRRESAAAGDGSRRWIFTHYATLPLSLLVPRPQRWYFVQGLEWEFLRRLPLGDQLLKRFMLFAYRRGVVISANEYLTEQLRLHGVPVAGEAPIWADERYAVEPAKARDVDVVMMLRKGAPKRLDLYRLFISELLRHSPRIKLAVITPEDEIAKALPKEVAACMVRPDLTEMAALYSRSRVFVFLSEHEGFGLPPLEAMGSGCVPICRDSGGVRSYMKGPLEALLVPLQSDIEAIAARTLSLLADEVRRAELGQVSMQAFRQGLTRTHDRVHALGPLFRMHTANNACPGATLESP